MESDRPRKRLRKGTKSCTECRRRKIACVWTGPKCRYCTGKERECVAQTDVALATEDFSGLPDRVKLLESQMRTLQHILAKPSEGPTQNPRRPTSIVSSGSYDAAESNSLATPGIASTTVRPLLENAFHLRGHEVREDQRPGTRSRLSATWDWWAAVGEIVPELTINSAADLTKERLALETPEECAKADPLKVAIWLLNFAITVHNLRGPPQLGGFKTFSTDVCHAVRTSIVADDELAGTAYGLECCLLVIRLQINLGYVKPAWLDLRRALSLAEIHNVASKAVAASQRGSDSMNSNDGSSIVGTMVGLIVLDRYLSVLLSVQSLTLGRFIALADCDEVSRTDSRSQFWSLAQVGAEINALDLVIKDRSDSDSTKSTNEADLTLVTNRLEDMRRMLDLQPGHLGRTVCGHSIPPLILLIFHYLVLRHHLRWLPLSRSADVDEYDADRVGAIREIRRSAREITELYLSLSRDRETPDFVVVRTIDFVAFTAGVLLLLDEHGILFNTPQDSLETTLLPKLVGSFQKGAEALDRPFAKQASHAIGAFRSILDSWGNEQEIEVLVPLMGKVKVWRRVQHTAPFPVKEDGRSTHRGESVTAHQDSTTDRPGAYMERPGSGTSVDFWTEVSFGEDHPDSPSTWLLDLDDFTF